MWNPFRKKTRHAGGPLPAFIPVLQELQRHWESLTPEEIDRCNSRLAKMGKEDVTLCVVESQEARRTWALADLLARKCKEACLQADAAGADDARYYREMAKRFDALEDCARPLFWAQVRDDMGAEAWEASAIGIRVGWKLVRTPPRPRMPDLSHLFGGEP